MFTIIHSCSLLLARYVQYWGEESYCNLVLRKWQEAGGAAGLSTQAHWNLPLTSWTYLTTVIDTHTHTCIYIYTHTLHRKDAKLSKNNSVCCQNEVLLSMCEGTNQSCCAGAAIFRSKKLPPWVPRQVH